MTGISVSTVNWWSVAFWAPFFVVLLMAVRSDLRERRVSNLLTGTLLGLGVVLSLVRLGVTSGLMHALGGAALGLAIWLPMYLMRLMGAGDVKLFAAGASWLGWKVSLLAAFSTGLLGGVLGLLWLLHRHGGAAALMSLAHALRAPKLLQLRPMDRRERIPYAIAIAGGLACGWWWTVLPR